MLMSYVCVKCYAVLFFSLYVLFNIFLRKHLGEKLYWISCIFAHLYFVDQMLLKKDF